MPAAIKKKKAAVAEANERAVDKSRMIEVALSKLDGEVIFGKRKREKPQAELNAEKWVDENFEEKVNYTMSRSAVYSLYLTCCEKWAESASIEITLLHWILKEKFPKGYALKESSPYHGKVKSRNQHKKPRIRNKPTIKIADVVIAGLEELGNPKIGVQVRKLKRLLTGKYPELSFYEHPKHLLMALERLVRTRHVERVRGIGLSGYYRLNRVDSDVEVKKEQDGNDSDSNSEGENKDDSSEKPSKKRKREEEGDEEKPAVDTSMKMKKFKKAKIMTEHSLLAIKHGDPQRIEDTFPLAFTYMSEPKMASANKIQKYLEMYYPQVTHDGVVTAMMKGIKKGYWVHRGSSYQLTITNFNPSDSNDTYDMICQAIVACHEPKKCTMHAVKQYVEDYHEGLDMAPKRLRRALDRALDKGLLRQMTGLGLCGTFVLGRVFTPSPALLAGEDDSGEQYRARPSRSRPRAREVKPRIKQEVEDDASEDRSGDLYVPKPSSSRRVNKSRSKDTKRRVTQEKEEEDDASEDRSGDPCVPRPSSSRRGNKSRPKDAKPRIKQEVEDDASEDRSGDSYVPRPSSSRSGNKSRSIDAKPRLTQEEEDDASEDRSGDPYVPRPSSSRRGNKSRSKDAKRQLTQEEEDEEVVDRSGDLYVPRPSSSRTPTKSDRRRDSKQDGDRKSLGSRNERKSHKGRKERKRK